MTTRPRLAPRTVGRALAASAALLLAAAAPDGAPAPRALFDGTSLDGWKSADFFKPGAVAVQDGAIVMTPGEGSMTGVTCTRTELPRVDYELAYEAKRLSGADFFAAATFPVGDAYITLVNGGWGGNITGLSSIDGSDASENETSTFIKYRDDTWYRFRVRVTATSIRCWLDDKEIIAVRHEGRQVGTRIEVRANRPLGFATWETRGAVRGVTVRPLTPEEARAVDVPER